MLTQIERSKMKTTLKHVANQYILIVDERPRHGEWWYHPNGVINNINNELNDPDYNDCCRIIAAENLNGVKGIAMIIDDRIITDIELISDFFNEYRFTDTEIEVTEEEDYYLIRL